MGKLALIRPDIVVLGLGRDETDVEIDRLLAAMPTTKFIVLSSEGRKAVGYELRMHRTTLPDVSPAGLIDLLRKAISKS